MNKAISYVYDFLSNVFEEDFLRKNIKEVILFGSVAKGMEDNDSDIDLFFNVELNIKDVEKQLRSVLKSFQVISDQKWGVKGIKYPISIIVDNLENNRWRDLKQEIVSSGIILFSRYKQVSEDVKHSAIFYYSLSGLERKDKMKIIRALSGYVLKKNSKIYSHEGIVNKIGGTILGPNAILVPIEKIIEIKNIFKKHKVKYKIIESWTRK